MPVALISISTSPAFGPSRSSSMISSGFFASNATAARVFILSSTFALQEILALNPWHCLQIRNSFDRSFLCHAGIFGFLRGRWFVFMLCGPAAGDCVVSAGPQIDIDVVEVADDVLVIAKCRHDVVLR